VPKLFKLAASPCIHTHTRTHTHIQYTHTHRFSSINHTYRCALNRFLNFVRFTHTYTHTRSLSLTHTHTHTHALSLSHTHTYTHTHLLKINTPKDSHTLHITLQSLLPVACSTVCMSHGVTHCGDTTRVSDLCVCLCVCVCVFVCVCCACVIISIIRKDTHIQNHYKKHQINLQKHVDVHIHHIHTHAHTRTHKLYTNE